MTLLQQRATRRLSFKEREERGRGHRTRTRQTEVGERAQPPTATEAEQIFDSW